MYSKPLNIFSRYREPAKQIGAGQLPLALATSETTKL